MQLAENVLKNYNTESKQNRDDIIFEYVPYVKRVVQRLSSNIPSHIDRGDLINAGIIGLIDAIEKFDPKKGNKFITYAAFRIRGSILSELRSRDFLTRSTRQKINEIQKVHDDLEKKYGREIRDEEIAKEMGMDMESFHSLKNLSGISFISFEDMGFSLVSDKEDIFQYLNSGDNASATNVAKLKELENSLAEAISQLNKKEKIVLSLYYWEELTMKEIGEIMEVTESRVSQIHSKAIVRLRGKIRRMGFS
jgi:RNA polymerase sigma factor for flagellar operon FliA